MRFIILIFFSLFPIISNCQSWTYSKGGNVFDGEYKTASVRGKGDKYPYNNPLLVVNIFNGNDINFYISDAGFFQKETDISTTWIFDNEKNVRYENISLSISGDGKNLFFDSFLSSENSNNEFVKMEMIDKLTKGNILYVRVSDRFGSNDLKFSLAGSSNAIGYVISKSIREKELNILRKEKKIKEEKLNAIKSIFEDFILLAQEKKLSSKSINALKEIFQDNLDFGVFSEDNSKILNSISLERDSSNINFDRNGKVSIFYNFDDGTREQLIRNWTLDMSSEMVLEYKKEKEIERKKMIQKQIKLYDSLTLSLKSFELKEESEIVLKKYIYNSLFLNDIGNIIYAKPIIGISFAPIKEQFYINENKVVLEYIFKSGKKEKIPGSFELNNNSPILLAVEKEVEKEKNRIDSIYNSLVDKYNRKDVKEHLKHVIKERVKHYNLNINLVEDIKISFSNYWGGSYKDCLLILYLRNNLTEKVENTFPFQIYKLNITKDDLEKMGGVENQLF